MRVLLVIGVIIYLNATDTPIDDDLTQHYEDALHGITYCVPQNWQYDAEDSNEDLKYYVR